MSILDKLTDSALVNKVSTNKYFYIGFHIFFYILGLFSYGLAGVICPLKNNRLYSFAYFIFWGKMFYYYAFTIFLVISLCIRNRRLNFLLHILFLASPWLILICVVFIDLLR